MSHFVVWLSLFVGAVIAAVAGISSWGTAADATYFSAVALLAHWLYETR